MRLIDSAFHNLAGNECKLAYWGDLGLDRQTPIANSRCVKSQDSKEYDVVRGVGARSNRVPGMNILIWKIRASVRNEPRRSLSYRTQPTMLLPVIIILTLLVALVATDRITPE